MAGKIIAFTGAHGTGKTTAVYGLAERCKRRGDSCGNVGIVLETARRCPMPIFSTACGKPSPETQMWIFGKQLQEEAEACFHYDLVICDRTLVDCIAYTRFLGYYMLAESMEQLAISIMGRYRQIVFRHIYGNDFLVDDGLRALDREDRERIEKIMLRIYKRMGIQLIEKECQDLDRLADIASISPCTGVIPVQDGLTTPTPFTNPEPESA